MQESRRCRNYPDHFCYLCGEFMLLNNKIPINDFVKQP